MIILKRKIYSKLLTWKSSKKRRAFCIVGARQIGKTTIVRHFAKENYENFIELNFLEDPRAKEIFSGNLNAQTIYLAITAYTNEAVIPDKTLILLAEIQECPNARTAVKFLAEDGRADIVETGSMLGVNIQNVPSYPVGFEEIHHMYPLDFEEYLWAINTPDQVIDYLKTCYNELQPLTSAIHSKMLETFQRYLIIGGMPAAVVSFLETQSITEVLKVQNEILELYRKDIIKYALKKDYPKILEIFNAIPGQLDQKNQRFMLNQVLPKTRTVKVEECFLWLVYAGLALPCYNLKEPQPPLTLNEKRSLFKFFLLDPGLLSAMSDSRIQFDILNGDLEINQGSVLENAAACQLKANGFDLFYFNSKKIGELDFVVQREKYPDLIEMKSGKTWTSHPALNHAMEVKDWKFNEIFVFCKGNVSVENREIRDEKINDKSKPKRIIYFPYYFLMFYNRENMEEDPRNKIPPFDWNELEIPAK